ncbi:MAG: hypothetical protein WCR49_05575 [Opitutae bacterium]
MQRRLLFVLPLALAAALLLPGCGPSAKEQQAAAAKRQAALTAAADAAKAQAAATAAEKAQEAAKTAATARANPKFDGLASARAEKGYVAVLYENGRKGMFPTAQLSEAENEWLTAFAAAHPLAHGKSTVVIAKTELTKTIVKQETIDGVETVQLRPPAKLRDQIGGTCMFYGRVHYLDIAGYPIQDGEIYRTINNCPHDEPYLSHTYYVGMLLLFVNQKPSPILHFPNGTIPPFEWARQELRKGRPVLSALPQNIWLSLPADFLANHPWDGNSKVGHQVVINGFTWNPATKKGTFHVVNSWTVLSEFDVPVEPRDEKNFVMEQSLSPRGEPPEETVKVKAGAVTLLKPVGKQFLYSVDTNIGPQKVMAPSEEAAKTFVELDLSAKDVETLFGEFIVKIYDYIYDNADPKIRDAAGALLLSEIFKIPETITLPHVDLEVKSANGNVYFVRTDPQKVVKMYADSTGDALEKAKRLMPGGKG